MSIVQQSAGGNGLQTLGATPTAGNMLIFAGGIRSGTFGTLLTALGYTAVPSSPVGGYCAAIYYKTAGAGEATTLAIGNDTAGTWFEWSGALTLDSHTEATGDNTGGAHSGVITCSAVTVPAGGIAFIAAVQGAGGAYDTAAGGITFTPGTGITEDTDHFVASGGPNVFAGHSTTSSLTPSITSSETTGFGVGTLVWAIQAAVFAAAPADPTPGMWADFGRDGFADVGASSSDPRLVRMLPQAAESVISDNITADVISIQIDRTLDNEGGTPVGTMTFVTKNTAGKYNPDNSASPVFGQLNPGMPIWFGCNDDLTVSGTGHTVYGRFAGYLRTLAPIPAAAATDAPTVEWIVDDPMARYRDAKARVAFSETRTVATYREALLDAIGETRFDLATEADTLPASGEVGVFSKWIRTSAITARFVGGALVRIAQPVVDKISVLGVLESLNKLVGTRHFIAPADTKEDWYTYSTRNRQYKLGAAADQALTAMVSDTSGYVHSKDGVENVMSVEVRPFRVAGQAIEVWSYGDLPFPMAAATPKQIVVTFEDQVFDAALTYASTGGNVSAVMVAYGTGATIVLTASAADTVTALSIDGRPVIRLDSFTVERSDAGSKVAYGEMQGEDVSSDLMTSAGLAEGIATYHIWANANPRKTPSVTIDNHPATILPLELCDVVTLTIPQLEVTAKRFEVIGLHETWRPGSAALQLVAFRIDLRQTPNASVLSLLTFGTSTYDGPDIFAP